MCMDVLSIVFNSVESELFNILLHTMMGMVVRVGDRGISIKLRISSLSVRNLNCLSLKSEMKFIHIIE